MKEIVKIGGKDIVLVASVFTLLEYKRIFGRCWYADKDRQEFLLTQGVALEKATKDMTYALEALGEEIEEQVELPQEIKNGKYELTFKLETAYAMAIAGGGFTGTQKDLFDISPKELDKILPVIDKLIKEFLPEIKEVKKKVAKQ